jgi:hypothetical protein
VALMQAFIIQDNKTNPYHPQVNGTIESFNKILDHGTTKVCNTNPNDYDDHVLVALWEYRTIVKWITYKHPQNWFMFMK